MRIVLEVTFRMGGVSYRGHRWEDDALVFEFERLGDAFIQVLSGRKVEEEVEREPERVIVELRTKGGAERSSKRFGMAKSTGRWSLRFLYFPPSNSLRWCPCTWRSSSFASAT